MQAAVHRKPTTWAKFIGAVWYCLICFLIFGIATIAGWASTSPPLKAILLTQLGLKNSEPKTIFNTNEMTVLVLGCDEDRYYHSDQILKDKARSDMILLAKFDFEKNRV